MNLRLLADQLKILAKYSRVLLVQAGLIERRHRQIVAIGLIQLFHSNMSLDFWANSFSTAVYLINRFPSSVLPDNKSPFKLLLHRTPEYTSFRVFGAAVVFHIYIPMPLVNSVKNLYPVSFLGTLLTSMAANVIIHQQDECIPADMFSLMKEYCHSRILPYCQLLLSLIHISHTLLTGSPLLRIHFRCLSPLSQPLCVHNWACLRQHLWKHKKMPLTLLLQCPLTGQHEMDIKKSIEPHQPTTLCCKSSHPMTTQFKCGIIKPNPKHALSVSTNFLSEPKIVSEALAHPG